jgi:CBS domain-containing protein
MLKRIVSEIMTPAPLLLGAQTTVDEALEVAREKRLHHLLVKGDDGTVNVVCLCDLLGRDPLDDSFDGTNRVEKREHLADFARPRTFVVSPGESLDGAANLMADEDIGCLPVVDHGRLVGVVTRSDLGRAAHRFDAIVSARCAACGSTEDIRRTVSGGARFCSSCWSDSVPSRDDEIGGGD